MAYLNVGLVREVPTRTFNEDSDDELEALTSEKCYDINLDFSVGDIQLLVVTTSKLSNDFMSIYVLPPGDRKKVGVLTEKVTVRQEGAVLSEKSGAIADLHKIGSSCCHLEFTQSLNLVHLNDVADLIFSRFSGESLTTIVLADDRVVQFRQASDGLEYPENFSRFLKTSSCGDVVPCQRLEQPNIIGGVPAAVLTEREFSGKPCILLVNYTDSEKTDSITLGGFLEPFFALDRVKQFVKRLPQSESDKRLKAIYEAKVDNIYL